MKADRPVSEGTASGNDRADFAMVFYECDARGEGVRWQGDCTRLLGYAATEMPVDLSGWLALIHPDDQAASRQAWTHRFAGPGPIRLEYRVRCRDGHYLSVSDESAAHPERGVIGVLAARRPPRWLDGPFRHFIETTPLGVLVVGRDGTIGVANRTPWRCSATGRRSCSASRSRSCCPSRSARSTWRSATATSSSRACACWPAANCPVGTSAGGSCRWPSASTRSSMATRRGWSAPCSTCPT